MVSKLYTIISFKLWSWSLYFGDRYNKWVLASQQKALGPCKCAPFRAKQTYRIIVLAICWRLSVFKSPSHKKSIFLKIRSFFPFKFFQGHNWLANYPDFKFHGHWKTMTLPSISPNASKHWRFFSVLAEFVLWELSIVSSLSFYGILARHAYNDRLETIDNSQSTNSAKTLKNLQCLLAFGLIEGNVIVFQWPWNLKSG